MADARHLPRPRPGTAGMANAAAANRRVQSATASRPLGFHRLAMQAQPYNSFLDADDNSMGPSMGSYIPDKRYIPEKLRRHTYSGLSQSDKGRNSMTVVEGQVVGKQR